MQKGYLNLVLHAHLPFVRHVDKADRLEERWLFEALTETYIPLLQVFKQLVSEGVDFRITISISPPLISMLADELLQSRYRQHLQALLTLAASEVERTRNDKQFHPLAMEYQRRFQAVSDFLDSYDGNILPAFVELANAGRVELITSTATHAFLPYVQTEEALRAQIATAVSVFRCHFGVPPKGVWLPECAYTPRVLPYLEEFSIQYFFVDTHTFGAANPSPVFSTFSPILTGDGIAAFARDPECSRQVWSSDSGYPGDFDYREYYRDIGFDLDDDYIRPYVHNEGIRVNTGFKYYRITGKGSEKEPYDFVRARDKAALHAGNFLFNRQQQVEHWHKRMGRLPIVTAPYDAELFGHWWYEGPVFLDMLLRKLFYDQTDLATITPSEYLSLYSDFQSCELSFSTWGRDGYGDVWLNPSNDWIYPALHDAEQTMVKLATRYVSSQNHDLAQPISEAATPDASSQNHDTGQPKSEAATPDASSQNRDPGQSISEAAVDSSVRALKQAARELMLAESSDWAFIMDNKSTTSYAISRTKQHINRFFALAQMLEEGKVDSSYLSAIEQIDNIFPDLDYHLYQGQAELPSVTRSESSASLCVLMLSWEFPPMSVGGLSRHVYDLSRHLAAIGCEVHVVTTAIGDYPQDEMVEGVHVHRVRVLQPDGGAFIHFVLQLNLMMVDRCRELVRDEVDRFDLIHAHDWLVAQAAKTLKQRLEVPLVATIHATEHGRNHGIFTDTQRHIHHQEWVLTYEAQRVIVCSSYMQHEVKELFQLPAPKLDVIPNGVDRTLLYAQQDFRGTPPNRSETLANLELAQFQHEPHTTGSVLFVGRLVREKGVHLLLDAAPEILAEFGDVNFVIVGKGPMMDELIRQAEDLNIRDHVVFTGYADDDTRNSLLQTAAVAVFPSLYEPFGIVALEAMGAGTPVVVADVGGLADIVQHNHNGLKVYPDNPHSIAEQVKRILRDNAFARRLSDTAMAELGRYDWRTIARQTYDVYQLVCPRGVSSTVFTGSSQS